MSERDIWFVRLVPWNYLPIHWKGWAIQLTCFAVAAVAFGIGILFFNFIGRSQIRYVALLGALPPIWILKGFWERHSRNPHTKV